MDANELIQQLQFRLDDALCLAEDDPRVPAEFRSQIEELITMVDEHLGRAARDASVEDLLYAYNSETHEHCQHTPDELAALDTQLMDSLAAQLPPTPAEIDVLAVEIFTCQMEEGNAADLTRRCAWKVRRLDASRRAVEWIRGFGRGPVPGKGAGRLCGEEWSLYMPDRAGCDLVIQPAPAKV